MPHPPTPTNSQRPFQRKARFCSLATADGSTVFVPPKPLAAFIPSPEIAREAIDQLDCHHHNASRISNSHRTLRKIRPVLTEISNRLKSINEERCGLRDEL